MSFFLSGHLRAFTRCDSAIHSTSLQSSRRLAAWMVSLSQHGATETERRPAILFRLLTLPSLNHEHHWTELPAPVIDPGASLFFFQSFDMPEHDLECRLQPQATKHGLTSRDRRSRPHASKLFHYLKKKASKLSEMAYKKF